MTQKTRQELANENAGKILGALSEVFTNEDSEYYINISEQKEDLIPFFYALMSLVPAYLYKKLTGDGLDILEINHLGNTIIFKMENDQKNEK